MVKGGLVLSVLMSLSLGSCGTVAPTATVTKSELSFSANPEQVQDSILMQQADSLNALTTRLVRNATMQGAAAGAALGCGLSAMSGNGRACVQGALVGGAVSGLIGHEAGKREVERRVEIVSLTTFLPSLRDAKQQMALVGTGLDAILSEQDAEIAALRADVANGKIPAATLESRMTEIRMTRAKLAEVLSLSSQQAKEANRLLADAKDQGQEGLDWYLMETDKLSHDAASARSMITLL